MKDIPHHIKKVQKKVLRDYRHQHDEFEEIEEWERKDEEYAEDEELVYLSDDNKRKGTRDYVRHMSQRERNH